MKENKPVILGIDPGYDRIGWAIGLGLGFHPYFINYGCIQTKKNDSLVKSYQTLDDELSKFFSLEQPYELAIEILYFSKNKKTAL